MTQNGACPGCLAQMALGWQYCPQCGVQLRLSEQPVDGVEPFAGASRLMVGVLLLEPDGMIHYANQAAQSLLSRAEPMTGCAIYDIIDEADHSVLAEGLCAPCDTGAAAVVEVNRGVITLQLHLVRHGMAPRMELLAFCVDLTKEKTALQHLENQDYVVSALYDTSLSIINRQDVNELLTTLLHKATELLKTPHGYIYQYNKEKDCMEMEIGIGMYRKERIKNVRYDSLGMGAKVWRTGKVNVVDDYTSWSERLPDTDRRYANPRAVVAVPLKSGDKVISIINICSVEEGRVFTQDEVQCMVQFGQLASIALNNAVLIQELEQEIDSRRESENALYASNQRLNAIMSSAKDFIYLMDGTFRFQEANAAMCRALSLDRHEVIGKTAQEVFGNTVDFLQSNLCALAGEAIEEEVTLQICGQELIFDKLETPLRNKDGKIGGISGIMRDATERKKAEKAMIEAQEAIARSERLASLGMMAAGISHEINQPLNSIKVNATGLLYRHKKNLPLTLDGVLDTVKDISLQVDRIDYIVQNMRTLIRDKRDNQLTACDINEAIHHMADLVESQLRTHGITLSKHVTQDLPRINATVIGLEEIGLNLLMNAIQALAEVKHDDKQIVIASRLTGDGEVILEVRDNGSGISDKIKKRIFDPFFTTKSNHHNMGVGLSITHTLVAMFQGRIEVDSSPQSGTSFQLYFQPYNYSDA